MATMRTSLTGNETQGEKQLYFRFRDKLSDDYHVWHNIHLLKARTEVDFIILHPAEGIYVLEVKDWPVEIIMKADASRVYIDKNGRTENLPNPVFQARQNSFAIRNSLINDPRMVHKEGKHKDQLVLPVNFGAVFPNITIQQLIDKGLDISFPLQYTLDQEFTRGQSYTDQDIEKALGHLRDRKFYPLLGVPQWNAINELLGTPVVIDPISSDLIGVFDENQEMLVKYKIGSQILIEGPAGSGKSLVLIKRALFMQQSHPNWKIGVFCFNVVMANFLKKLLENEDPDSDIIVSHFHGISKAGIRKGKLDAVLVDEGQDINIKQLELISNLLVAPDSPITIFYDNRQALYESENIHQMLSECGFQIEYSKELVRQQRSLHIVIALAFYEKIKNPDKAIKDVLAESLSVSERFFKGYSDQTLSVSSGTKRFFSHDQNRPHNIADELGRRLIVREAHDLNDMLRDFIDFIKEKVEINDAKYSDFLIIYPKRRIHWHYPSAIKKNLSKHKIPFRIVDTGSYDYKGYFANLPDFEIIEEGDNRKADLNDNVVKAMTINQSKGIDTKYAAIMGFDGLDISEDDRFRAAELGYVGLTRAKEFCMVYCTEKLYPVEVIEEIISELKNY